MAEEVSDFFPHPIRRKVWYVCLYHWCCLEVKPSFFFQVSFDGLPRFCNAVVEEVSAVCLATKQNVMSWPETSVTLYFVNDQVRWVVETICYDSLARFSRCPAVNSEDTFLTIFSRFVVSNLLMLFFDVEVMLAYVHGIVLVVFKVVVEVLSSIANSSRRMACSTSIFVLSPDAWCLIVNGAGGLVGGCGGVWLHHRLVSSLSSVCLSLIKGQRYVLFNLFVTHNTSLQDKYLATGY